MIRYGVFVLLCWVGRLVTMDQAAFPSRTGPPLLLGQTVQGSRLMPSLHIALHDGFSGHHARIAVDGQVVFDQPGVRTDLRISRADSVDATVPPYRITVSVSVEPGGITGSAVLDASATPYLAIDLMPDGTVRCTPSTEPFRYL